MVILKRLSLKALSALQNHDGGGGRGKKNKYTNVSLRLCIYISTSTHSHIYCMHSLYLSLSLPPFPPLSLILSLYCTRAIQRPTPFCIKKQQHQCGSPKKSPLTPSHHHPPPPVNEDKVWANGYNSVRYLRQLPLFPIASRYLPASN